MPGPRVIYIFFNIIYSIFTGVYTAIQVQYEKKKNNPKTQMQIVLDHFFPGKALSDSIPALVYGSATFFFSLPDIGNESKTWRKTKL